VRNPNRKHGPHKRRKNMARLLDIIPESRRLFARRNAQRMA
jgi:hypothetical protein